jgi:uncharacterized protein (DUF1697 family)
MEALRDLHEKLGFEKVVSLIQSGNVVFEYIETDPPMLANLIGSEFDRRFGFHSEVIVRTPAELQEIYNHNPFHESPEKESKFLVVMFLSAPQELAAYDALIAGYNGLEEIRLGSRELFIYYSEGQARTKLTNVYIEKKLKVQGTARNWNTVTKLLEMAQR